MKAILEEFPHSPNGSSILLGRLQESLFRIPIVEANAPLIALADTCRSDFVKGGFATRLLSSSFRPLAVDSPFGFQLALE